MNYKNNSEIIKLIYEIIDKVNDLTFAVSYDACIKEFVDILEVEEQKNNLINFLQEKVRDLERGEIIKNYNAFLNPKQVEYNEIISLSNHLYKKE